MRKKELDPFDWNNISIDKYYKMKDILDGDEDDITKNVRLVAVVTGKDESEVWDMDLGEVGDLIGRLRFLNKFDVPKTPELKIQLPNYKLVVMKDLSKISISQYVDFQSFATMPLKDGMDKILSIFLIPEGCTYNNGYDIVDVQREIRENLSFRTAEGFLGFFIKKYSELLIHSLKYLRRIMKKEKDETKMMELMEKQKRVLDQFQGLIHLIG